MSQTNQSFSFKLNRQQYNPPTQMCELRTCEVRLMCEKLTRKYHWKYTKSSLCTSRSIDLIIFFFIFWLFFSYWSMKIITIFFTKASIHKILHYVYYRFVNPHTNSNKKLDYFNLLILCNGKFFLEFVIWFISDYPKYSITPIFFYFDYPKFLGDYLLLIISRLPQI